MTRLTTLEFLARLRRLDINLWAEDDRLRYNAPQGALTPDLRAELSARKTELLEFLRQAHTQSLPLTPVSRPPNLPLSFAQQRLWFFDQLEPDNPTYNETIAFHLAGWLNLAALEQSLGELVRRHESLRTTFVAIDGQPAQIITPGPDGPWKIPVIDLPPLPSAQRDKEARRLVSEAARQPFNLAQGPLLRVILFRLTETEHVLLLVMHHIITDGWSTELFCRELTQLYNAFSAGLAPSLPNLPLQYADFALWQRQWLQGEILESQLAYWQQRLGHHLPIVELPTDRPRPAVQTFRGATQTLRLSPELSEALRTLSRQAGVTLFMTLLAAFKTLLYRYTGQTDLVVGLPIANRTRIEIEGLIGFFVNTLVLGTNLSGNPTFQELLGRIRETMMEAEAHQDLPFEKLVEVLHPSRDLSRNPLFQIIFAPQPSLPTLDLASLTVSPFEIDLGIAKFELTLYLTDTPQGLLLGWEYNTDLFDSATITRMMGHYQTLLEGLVVNPNQRLADLPLLTTAEQQQLLVEWNNTTTAYPRQQTIPQLFEIQADQTPAAVAVTFENEALTYSELNQWANQLAHWLQAQGVGLETGVGLCLERSLEMVGAILGILKAGGFYLPLDPTYPAERLAFMAADVRTPLILTQQQLSARLPAGDYRIICLDTAWPAIASQNQANPLNRASAENLAYVMYTSGSTGRPKGVGVSHHNVVRLVKQTHYANLTAAEVFLQFAPISFDASTLELWGPLLNGGRLVIFPAYTPSLAELSQVLRQQQITTLWLTAGLFQQMVDAHLDSLTPIRQLLAGGDVLSAPHVQKVLQAKAQNGCLINGYGPTESTTFACCYPMTSVEQAGSPVPIGRPIANTQVYILDADGQPVPVGVPGELYIGGDGLARGYFNRPDLTAEKFVPHPFSPQPGQRLYRTGDLVRYRPDGNIEFLGRIDQQVKIRGFRVELGEIEAALRLHPTLQEVVVLARSDKYGPGQKQLVAYLVTAPGNQPTLSDLRHFLKQTLPDYMIPAAFVFLPALPLTPNGKVDRRALPAPDEARLHPAEKPLAPPQTPLEQLLAEIWAKVLQLEQVGVHDNFFELGGDSILSIQIIARANQAGLRLTPRQFFQHQTIAELAAVADTVRLAPTEQGLITGPLPLTPIQHWFFEQNLPEPHHWNQAMLLDARQPLNPELLEQAVQPWLAHHDALRLRFTPPASTGAGWQQVNAGLVENTPFIRLDWSALPPAGQKTNLEATAAELQASLNLEQGPLVKVALFDLGPQQPQRLLIIIHHLAVDGVSWRILLEDLQSAYRQLERGEAIQLPAKSTSFKRWAELLAQEAPNLAATGQAELAYWQAEPPFAPPSLPLDTPEGRPANTEASARAVLVSLNPEETRALLQDVPAAYHTQINDVLLTALGQTLAAWTGVPITLLNLEGHGREEILAEVDLSRTVGWFTTIFPVYLDLREATQPGAALKSVKEQLRRIPSRGIGYGMLRYLSQNPALTTLLRARPQAKISFNYLGQFDQVLDESALFSLAGESSGPEHSLQGLRRHILEVEGAIIAGQLQLTWIYSEKLHRRATIERLAQDFMAALRALMSHCLSPEAGGYTPSDFPEADLSQAELDDLLAELDETME